MKRVPSGIRVTDPVSDRDLACAIRASQLVGDTFFATPGSHAAKLLACARSLIREAQILNASDGGPRWTDPR